MYVINSQNLKIKLLKIGIIEKKIKNNFNYFKFLFKMYLCYL